MCECGSTNEVYLYHDFFVLGMSRVRKEGVNEDGSNEEESGGGGSSSEEEGEGEEGEGVRCGVERDGADDNDEDNDEDNDGDDEENDDNDEENDGDDDNDSVNSSSSSEVSVLDANSSVVLDLPPLTTHNNTTNSTPSEVSSSSTEETLDQENEREKYIPEALRVSQPRVFLYNISLQNIYCY